MNLNTEKLHLAYMLPVFFERLRWNLLDKGQLLALNWTYRSQQVFLPDSNSPKFWDDKFATFQPMNALEDWRFWQVMAEISAQDRVLNLGVGRGEFEKKLASRWPNLDYTATDITTKTLARLKKDFPQYQFCQRQLTSLRFKDESFDVVLLLEVMEHISPRVIFKVLAEVRRVLKPGGKLIVSVPVNEGLPEMLPENSNSHLRIYSEGVVKFELLRSGFKVVKVKSASAFKSYFKLKNWLNSWLKLRLPNNLVLVAKRR